MDRSPGQNGLNAMKCPECGTEYRDEFTHCHDCEIPLVSDSDYQQRKLAAEADREKYRDMKIVEVCSVQGVAEADVIQGMLESLGIESMTRGHSVLSVHPFTMDGMGEVRILVAEPDVEAAREAIATFFEEES
ncbi:putative signal transducing protein [Gemmatimonadota bacterium]